MKDNKTNAQMAVEKANGLKMAIIDILKISELEYCYMQYETGLEYLRRFTNGDTYALERNRTFWNWWKNHWALRDEQFVTNGLKISLNSLRQQYEFLHDVYVLVESYHPNRVTLERSYYTMIDQVTKEAVRI